jgi:hypothetical protein
VGNAKWGGVKVRVRRTLTAGPILVGLAMLLLLPAAATGAPAAGTELDLALCAPRQNTFSVVIDNTTVRFPSISGGCIKARSRAIPSA